MNTCININMNTNTNTNKRSRQIVPPSAIDSLFQPLCINKLSDQASLKSDLSSRKLLNRHTFEIDYEDENEFDYGDEDEDENDTFTHYDLELLIHDVDILSTREKIAREATKLRLEAAESSYSEELHHPDGLLEDDELQLSIYDVDILSTRGKIAREATKLRLEASYRKELRFEAAEASCSQRFDHPDGLSEDDDELQLLIYDVDILSTRGKIAREATKLRLGVSKAY